MKTSQSNTFEEDSNELNTIKIGYLRAFTDNYIWFMRAKQDIVVVDPGESAAMLDYIITNKLRLRAIILTHDHSDHVGGVSDLLAYASVPVYGNCDLASYKVSDGEQLELCPWLHLKAIATPGHTYSGISYVTQLNGKKHLFCGDTLFAAGCGRVFTGDYTAMYNSLTRLINTGEDILVYPGHEYTLKNLQFAHHIEPDNVHINHRIKIAQDKLDTYGNTLPAIMADELLTNPFLRCKQPAVIKAVSQFSGVQVAGGLECFTKLRDLKDNF